MNKDRYTQVEIKTMDTPVQVVMALSEISGVNALIVSKALKYNVLTVTQVAMITGQTIATIEGRLKPQARTWEPVLNTVYPFKVGDKKGFKFIMRDEKFQAYINQFINQ